MITTARFSLSSVNLFTGNFIRSFRRRIAVPILLGSLLAAGMSGAHAKDGSISSHAVLLFAAPQDPSQPNSKKSKPPKNTSKGKKTGKVVIVKKQLLVFPTDAKTGFPEQVTDIVTEVIKGRLSASEEYEPSSFLTSLSTVKRAVSEQTLTAGDIKPPYDNNTKIQKITNIAGYNYAVVSSIDDYQYDAAKQHVDISVTISLIDFSSGKPQPRSFGDSATTADKSAKDANDTTAAVALARSLAEKLMTQVLAPAKSAAPSSTETPKPGTSK